jgi:hypothetical protein
MRAVLEGHGEWKESNRNAFGRVLMRNDLKHCMDKLE